MTTQLFGSPMPDRFGHLGTSLFTLFQVMTTLDWAAVARQVMETHPPAWIFFVVYILVSTFALLNLFIAVVVRAMEQQVAAERVSKRTRSIHGEPGESETLPFANSCHAP
jgi:voltage-gated sodium channel